MSVCDVVKNEYGYVAFDEGHGIFGNFMGIKYGGDDKIIGRGLRRWWRFLSLIKRSKFRTSTIFMLTTRTIFLIGEVDV